MRKRTFQTTSAGRALPRSKCCRLGLCRRSGMDLHAAAPSSFPVLRSVASAKVGRTDAHASPRPLLSSSLSHSQVQHQCKADACDPDGIGCTDGQHAIPSSDATIRASRFAFQRRARCADYVAHRCKFRSVDVAAVLADVALVPSGEARRGGIGLEQWLQRAHA